MKIIYTDLGEKFQSAVGDGRSVLQALPRVVRLEPAEHELVVLRLAVLAQVVRPRLQVGVTQRHFLDSQFLLRREAHSLRDIRHDDGLPNSDRL